MPLLSDWSWLLLSTTLGLTAALVPSPDPALLSSRQTEASINITYLDAKTVRYNGYEIHNCGHPGNKHSKTNLLLGFLSQMKPQLERVIADAQKGVRSQHGYAAFFKSNRNIGKVERIFQNLVDANPIIVKEERVEYTALRTRTPQPRFRCVNEGELAMASIIEKCTAHPLRTPLIIWPGSEIMAVCPDFFKIKQYPTSPKGCPTLEGGKFRSFDGELIQVLFAFVVYSLVTMYNRELHTTYHNWDDMWDMQYAVELNSRQSLLNAASYGYYAGGKLGGPIESPGNFEC